MLDISGGLDYMADLFLGENLRKPELLSGIKGMGNNIRRGQNMLKKEATALGRSRNKRDRLSYIYPFPHHVLF